MKLIVFSLLILTAIFDLSCQNKVKSSPISPNERMAKLPKPTPTPSKYEQNYIIGQISMEGKTDYPIPLEYKGFKINAVVVKKKFDKDSPVAGIYDAVLSKNGKTITRFEGSYYPLGNFMSFGLFAFLGGSEKQLIVLEESMKYDHEWILRLSPKFEVLFDAADFEVDGGGMRLIDIDKDGVYELIYGKYYHLDFMFSMNGMPSGQVIFKYDSKTRKYLPASHFFTDFTLDEIDNKIQQFNNNSKSFSLLLEIFMTYIYAGKEDEAWKYFDENFSTDRLWFGVEEDKVKTKEKIISALQKDKIYQFIQNDLKKRSQN